MIDYDKLTIAAFIILVVLALGSAYQRSNECKAKGGTLIESEYSSTCVKKDSIIDLK